MAGSKSWRIPWWDKDHWGWVAASSWSGPDATDIYNKIEAFRKGSDTFTTAQLLEVMLRSTRFRHFVRSQDWTFNDTKPMRHGYSMQRLLSMSIVNAMLGHLMETLPNGEKQQVYVPVGSGDVARSVTWKKNG